MSISSSQSMQGQQQSINVGQTERWISGALGGILITRGITRFSIGGLIEAGIGGALFYRAFSGHCPAYEAMGVNTANRQAAKPSDYFQRGIHIERSVFINRSPQEIYRFWRDFTNLPGFMSHLQEVTLIDDQRSHWKATGPAGSTIEWDAEIIAEEPDRLISWHSLANSEVDSAGTVRFLPQDQGTRVHVNLDYIPPAGRLGSALATLLGQEPGQQIEEDLQRLKNVFEAETTPSA